MKTQTRFGLFCLSLFVCVNLWARPVSKITSTSPKVILLSIDGFPSYYLENEDNRIRIPNLKHFFSKSNGLDFITTVQPSITYPAHTSMVTGEDPILHGILNNTPFDPFDKNDSGWMWYSEDIQVPTIWDLAKKKGKKVANVYWPVTVGADIQWNLPQYWRKKNPEDDKLLRVISSRGLHREAERFVGKPLNETTGDGIKLGTAAWLWKKYKPDLLLLYTTDLDTVHHARGPYSEEALAKLEEIDRVFGKFVQEINLYSAKDTHLVLVSDHGFSKATKICSPNVLLVQKGKIEPTKETFSYIFKSSGGSALLFSKDNIVPPFEELQNLKRELEEKCPGVFLEINGPKWETVRQTTHKHSIAYLWTELGIHISGSKKGETFVELNTPIYGHGYDPSLPEMKTIGAVYSKSKAGKQIRLSSVRDVFASLAFLLGIPKQDLTKK